MKLFFIVLDDTRITDGGIEHLKGLAHLSWLNLEHTQISDQGLIDLKGLTNLQRLSIVGTKASLDPDRRTKRALPGVEIFQ